MANSEMNYIEPYKVNRELITITPTGAGANAVVLAEVVNGICYVYFRYIQYTNSGGSWQTLCTLPEGYIPKYFIDTALGGNGAYGVATVGTSSEIAILSPTLNVNMFGCISYPVD